MSDFVAKTVSKSATRELTTPITSLVAYNTLIHSILTDNPWACNSYTSGGETLAGVRQTASAISGSVIYTDTDEKQIGSVRVTGPTSTAFSIGISETLTNSDLTDAMGGTPSHKSADDNFSTTLTCHDSNGEVYKVTIARDKVTVSGYVDDSILTRIETWADAQEILA